jgi:copper resistance protein C
MRIVITIVIASLAWFAGPSRGAQAHAMLDHASPRVGTTVLKAPREIVLWFTEALEPAFCRIEVRNVDGVRVDAGKARVDRANRTALRVPVKPLSAGAYNVFWHVLSVDTHTTQGNFLFYVGK